MSAKRGPGHCTKCGNTDWGHFLNCEGNGCRWVYDGDEPVTDKPVVSVTLPGKSAGDLLQDAADLFKERAKQYGASYYTHGPVVAALFPDGVQLKTAEDFNRFAILNLMVTKLVRYCNNFHLGGHQDSVADLAVYTKMLEEVDARVADGSLPWIGRFYSGKADKPG